MGACELFHKAALTRRHTAAATRTHDRIAILTLVKTVFVLLSLLLLLTAACAPGATDEGPEVTTVAGQEARQPRAPGLEDFTVQPLPREARWRVAVPRFEVRSGSLKLRGEEVTDRDPAFFVELGAGVADIFINEAFRSGQFILIERAQLEHIIVEQDLGRAGRIDPETAAEAGRIVGAELLILGNLTEFSVTSTGGGGRLFGILGGSAEVVTARVTVDIRFVDAETAEIVAIGSSTSEVSQHNVRVDVFNIIQGLQAGRTGTTIVDVAVRNAIVGAINDGAQNLPEKVQAKQ